MKGRIPTRKMTRSDMPNKLSSEVEAVLEIDRLFWIDHPNQLVMQRRLVPGEELPYQVPDEVDKDGNRLTMVEVHRWGRTIIVEGTPVLHILDKPEKQFQATKGKGKKQKKIPYQKPSLDDFRRFLGKHTQTKKDREKVTPEQIEAERQRQRELSKKKQAQRIRIGMKKRGEDVSTTIRR